MKNSEVIGADKAARPVPKTNTIICGDCLEIMPLIPDKSVDMILCDLPYGKTACKWDTVISFASLWEQYERLTDGPIVLFGSQPFFSSLVTSKVDWFREELVWLKNRAGNGFGNKHMKIHENIAVFSKNPIKVFNPRKVVVDDNAFLTKRKTFDKFEIAGNNVYSPMRKTRLPDDGTRNPFSIVPFSVTINTAKNKVYKKGTDVNFHPTQKPLPLIEYLIETYSTTCNTVLDNCIGSGTTAIACINTGRNYIGIEKEEKYCRIAEERIHALKRPALRKNI